MFPAKVHPTISMNHENKNLFKHANPHRYTDRDHTTGMMEGFSFMQLVTVSTTTLSWEFPVGSYLHLYIKMALE